MSAPAKTSRNTAEHIKEYGMKVDYCVEDMAALKKRVNQRCKEWDLTEQFAQLQEEAAKLDPSAYQHYSTIDNYIYFNMAQFLNVTAEYELNDKSKVLYKLKYMEINPTFNELASGVMQAMQEKAGTGINADLDIAYSELICSSNANKAFLLLSNISNPIDDSTDQNVVSNFCLCTNFYPDAITKKSALGYQENIKKNQLAEYLKESTFNAKQILECPPNNEFAPSQYVLTSFLRSDERTAALENVTAKGYIPAMFQLVMHKDEDELTEGDKDALLYMARRAYAPAQRMISRFIDRGVDFAGKVDTEELDQYKIFYNHEAAEQAPEDVETAERISAFLKRTRNKDRGGAVAAVSEVGLDPAPEAIPPVIAQDNGGYSALEGGDERVGDLEGMAAVRRPTRHGILYHAAEASLTEDAGMTIAGILDEVTKETEVEGKYGVDREEHTPLKDAAALKPLVPTPPATAKNPQGNSVGAASARGRRIR